MSRRRKFLLAILGLFIAGFLLPERRVIPVLDATSKDWNPKTFWFEPWGTSGVHKGVDIFAAQGQPVLASTDLIVLYRGQLVKGGLVVVGLGPKWRLHYFAHLDAIDENAGLFARAGYALGSVGTTGNAAGKQPHLHFSIVSLVPLPWRIDSSSQGYKKAFYLDPTSYFEG